MNTPTPGQIYRHYKGDLYVVLAVENKTVSYFRFRDSSYWNKPVTEFIRILGDMDEGTQFYRFQQVDPKEIIPELRDCPDDVSLPFV